MLQPWFNEAKLGIFLHWGIYAVDGVPESWSWYRGSIAREDYFAQAERFAAEHYDPAEWARLFRRAGARYAVLTTKHHDGFALWDTDQSDLSAVKAAPARRDLIAPYAEAMRAEGLKVGFYFSHLDWHHPDYASIRPKTKELPDDPSQLHPLSHPRGEEDPEAWERFLRFHRAQLEELCTRYGKVDLLWFDGDWERDAEQWRMEELAEQLRTWQPEVVLNNRLGGHGDYATPEQGQPIVPPEGPWEFCMTMNDSWGYQVQDDNYKSVRQLVRIFSEIVGLGGNLLLDVGPYADGPIPPEAVERLEALGDWIRPRAEAIYPATAGLPCGHWYGPTTLSKDRRTLYLFQFDRPWEQVALRGVRNAVRKMTVLGSGHRLRHKVVGGAAFADIPGTIWIDLPEAVLDPYATVIQIELDGELNLWRGKGRTVEAN